MIGLTMDGKRKRMKAGAAGKFLIPAAAACAVLFFAVQPEMFRGTSYSTVVRDRNGELLGARISDDGQWRFPPSDSVPEKFKEAVIEFEDRHFYMHPGVDPLAIARAVWQNLSAGKTVSGGSTITMQTIRMSGKRERTIWNKMVEAMLAVRLELHCTKDEILNIYASHAPFGGNVVGLEAASWRYFGRGAYELSWGEAALLAVLPNAPSAIHPGKNRDILEAKRNSLLGRLLEKGTIDSTEYELALSEPVPEIPYRLPDHAYHYVESLDRTRHGKETVTDIDIGLQERVEEIADRWRRTFSENGINDLAAVVIDVRTGKTVAYCGNAEYGNGREGAEVDIVQSPRSTGSILKPLLYCALLEDGMILPKTLLPDIPVNINGFSPQNFDRKFHGAVPADEALARSLNVPSVHMLRKYGVSRFHALLRKCGMTTLENSPDHYGLSLILGGAEGRLIEITRIYAGLAETAVSETSDAGRKTTATSSGKEDFPLDDRMSVYCTLQALREVNRPDEMDWKTVPSLRQIAWKTGTSYGFRDAWAVGTTPEYAVGVWVGNAAGNGMPGLTGARTAGPVMFDIFNLFPPSGWFSEPYAGFVEAETCSISGMLKGPYCNDADTVALPPAATGSGICPYHRPVTVSEDGRFTVPAGTHGSKTENFFILPPAMEWFYRQNHPEYRPLPPARPGSQPSARYSPMEFIYPENGSTVYLPKQLDGKRKGIIFSIAHSNPETTVFWHDGNSYAGETRHLHQMRLDLEPGKHTITAVDSEGYTVSVTINVCEKH